MRFISMVKACENFQPTPELFAAMDTLTAEMTQRGILLDSVGLMPSAHGGRIRLSGGTLTRTDGPFAEAKEVIGGYAILKADSYEEAMELGRHFVELHRSVLGDGFEMELEVRQLMDAGAMG
jgi:hypothetical protein